MALAITNEQMKRSTKDCPKFAAVALALRIPEVGKSTKGTKLVTAMGTASVIHQQAIRSVTAAAILPSIESPAGAGANDTSVSKTKPRMSPIRR